MTEIPPVFREHFSTLSMVVLVELAILVLQGIISYGTAFSVTVTLGSVIHDSSTLELVQTGWFVLLTGMAAGIIVLLVLGYRAALFRAIVLTNGVLTLGLFNNMAVLLSVLSGLSLMPGRALMIGVAATIVSNILVFSVWYWIIDPPGIEEKPHQEEPWQFFFPQRANEICHYEVWQPGYPDYLFLAFTTAFCFSPSDTAPLTRRAKMLMLLQSVISVITVIGIAGSAINVLS